MSKLIFSTTDTEPKIDDESIWAKFYNKHNFKEIFDSYMAWGPTSIEIHCSLTPKKGKLIVENIYYHIFGGKEFIKKKKAPRDDIEDLCYIFNLGIKSLKNTK